jgi:hypothetical protein
MKSRQRSNSAGHEEGVALVLALLATLLVSLLGLYLVFSAETELRISDNDESATRARMAANAGINHAREALRGLRFSDQLTGPSGTYDGSPANLAQARTYDFRNPVDWFAAGTLDLLDPAADPGGLSSAGIINTGYFGSTFGVEIIPGGGIAFAGLNPNGGGTLISARYFVKVSDNNGEASELARDPADNPFIDGDGTLLVRSVGVARTLLEPMSSYPRRNSVVVYEARFQRNLLFSLDSAVVIEGNGVDASFIGGGNLVVGGAGGPGIGVVDSNVEDPIHPATLIAAAANGMCHITGGGRPDPSIEDITATISSDPSGSGLLSATYLFDFAHRQVSRWADQALPAGPVRWDEGNAPDLGTYDTSKSPNDPSQHPRVFYVDGDLTLQGNVSGAGVLVVTGDFAAIGPIKWTGLIIVIGTGSVELDGASPGILGGIVVAKIAGEEGAQEFGTPSFHMRGGSVVRFDSEAVQMAVRLFPVNQTGFREITRSMDP